MFSNKDLRNMIVPLFLEQLLVMLVGVADGIIVSYAGEQAVSGVSLVNSFNTIFIYLFSALAAGGAVVISQYLGKGNKDSSSESASQLLTASTLFSVVIAAVVLVFHKGILGVMFGEVEAGVMEACITYLVITACSFPAIAIYNSGASLCRSLGKTKITLYISIIANIINVVGNYIGVFVLDAGVAGVAYPTLISHVFSAVAVTAVCFNKNYDACYRLKYIFGWNGGIMKSVLGIAVPNGIENGIFQLVKVALSSVVALFGTYQIAANGVAQTIWSLAALMGVAFGPVFITVIGRCMGAGDVKAAAMYFKKLTKLALGLSIAWNAFIFAITPVMMLFYDLSDQTKHLIIILVLIHNVFNAFAFPFSGLLGNGLRACGDVKFTMYVSVASTVLGRLVFSLIFALVFNMGVIGIAFAMCLDWCIRAVTFIFRVKGGKWKTMKVIH